MKRITFLIIIFIFIVFSTSILAKSSDQVNGEFLNNLKDKLKKENPYYHANTVSVEQTISFQGEVTKVIKQDDPKTAANEQELKTYKSNLLIGLADYKEIRGNLFTFDKKEIYYYDEDKKEFLTSQNVLQNQQAEEFFRTYMKSTGIEKSTFTEILIVFLILILIFVPWIIAFIQSKRMPFFTIYRY